MSESDNPKPGTRNPKPERSDMLKRRRKHRRRPRCTVSLDNRSVTCALARKKRIKAKG